MIASSGKGVTQCAGKPGASNPAVGIKSRLRSERSELDAAAGGLSDAIREGWPCPVVAEQSKMARLSKSATRRSVSFAEGCHCRVQGLG